ncbi:MAG TPA: UDP-N-acetylmuramate dehydrogenase [Candidatus Pacearchaeota archaeon]|nr:UDP-N-acetylmuramate dehydrogenase [Candidatus Parcubacteria bacterium]HOU45601.1 UDP-N-acetylmuramate dehydrogenase [Candidatus Pacearchaeota archaeon]HQI74242.1 UDP-N-acetylmuramate dehydrogenase [Candidatus Pacearchaeota archaeon]
MDIKRDILLKDYSTYKIGGPARFFCIAKNNQEIKEALLFSKENNFKIFILGGGSNILFPDEGFDGLVIKMENKGIKKTDNIIEVESGTLLSELVFFAKENNLSGMEWGNLIPGTIGGAVANNSGISEKECISNFLKSVKVIDLRDLEEKIFLKEDCRFEYRSSLFKKEKFFLIISCKLELLEGDKEKIEKDSRKIIEKRLKSQPYNMPSAGSVFKNPNGSSAGELIDKAGLKGFGIGDAVVSELHGNFILNQGNATANDIKLLINKIKKDVKDKFNVELQEEIEIV